MGTYAPFLLDRWIEQKHSANAADQKYDLKLQAPVPSGRSANCLRYHVRTSWKRLLNTSVSYTSAVGTLALRAAIAALEGVEADEVQVVTGAAEALLILFFLAAQPGANVVLPKPGFPANTVPWRSLSGS